MENLSPELIEIILGFVRTEDVKNFGLTCKYHHSTVQECTQIGWLYCTKIINCQQCEKFGLHPITVKLRIANRPEGDTKYKVCSKNCKHWFLYRFPRCNFCLNTVTYDDQIDRTLFCSTECVENSEHRIPRERYIT